MNNTFVNKVCAERAILNVLNTHFGKRNQLAGLSGSAIDKWSLAMVLPREGKLISMVRELADLCQRLSDRSHETFKDLDSDAEKKVLMKLDSLKRMLTDTSDNWNQAYEDSRPERD